MISPTVTRMVRLLAERNLVCDIHTFGVARGGQRHWASRLAWNVMVRDQAGKLWQLLSLHRLSDCVRFGFDLKFPEAVELRDNYVVVQAKRVTPRLPAEIRTLVQNLKRDPATP
jgi:predicted Fe-S protein YdhL (DUF1289 family)